MSKPRGWWLLPLVGVGVVAGWLRNRRAAASRPPASPTPANPPPTPPPPPAPEAPEKKGFDPLRPVRAFDRFQQRHRSLSIPLAVVKKFGDDGAGDQAALIAYWGFFSIFPLLLVFVTVLGFVLVNHPDTQQAVLDSALKDIPLIGDQLKTHSLKGHGLALAIGIVVTLLSGLAVTISTQKAFDRVYAIPYRRRANFLTSRLRGVVSLAVLGVLQVISTGASGLVAGGIGGGWLTLAGIAVSLMLNVILFAAVFRLLTSNEVHMSEMWPGVFSAAVLWELLQVVGGVYIAHVVKGASATYGTFATVIGLLTWLFLGARVVVYSAELNTVLARGLWPRSLLEPSTEADRETLEGLARVEERADGQQISVEFRSDKSPP
jgi:membrane protein